MLNCLQTTVHLFRVTLFYMVWNLLICLARADVVAGLLVFDHNGLYCQDGINCRLQVLAQDFT